MVKSRTPSYGQHFLKDKEIINRILKESNISSNDVVVEIGPGYQALTKDLIKCSKKLIAIEIDQDISRKLKEFYAGNKSVTILSQDVRDFNPGTISDLKDMDYILVGNLPYYTASFIVRKFLECSVRPKELIIMLQKEVADSMSAETGKMKMLSVATQFYGEVIKLFDVDPISFSPPPKVISSVVRIKVNKEQMYKVNLVSDFFKFVKAGFYSPRKKISNSLSLGLSIEKELVRGLLEEARVDPNCRPSILTIEEWVGLYEKNEERI